MSFTDWSMVAVGIYGSCLFARGIAYAIAGRRKGVIHAEPMETPSDWHFDRRTDRDCDRDSERVA